MRQMCFPGFEPAPLGCCFTGSRHLPDSLLIRIQEKLIQEISRLSEQGIKTFYAGGALGFDMLAEDAILHVKETFPQIKFHLVLPCRNQTERWALPDIKRYQTLLSAADETTYTSEQYEPGCMHRRNRWMVEHSRICICWTDGKDSGSAYTAAYALSKGLEIINLAEVFPFGGSSR